MTPSEAYKELCDRSRQITYLGSAVAVLNWDQRTMIPPKGHEHRVGQLTFLAGMYHKMKTDSLIGELLDLTQGSELAKDPLSVQAVNIRLWKRSYEMAVKIPEKLAVDLARASAEGQSVWEQAKPRNDWNLFKPYLERIVALKREEAEALGYEHEPYDALLDRYEEGETTRKLQPIFERLRVALLDLLSRLQGSGESSPKKIPDGRYPPADQKALAVHIATKIGYDMDAGRLDESAHPFTTGIGPGDVRITSRYRDDSFHGAIFTVLHETGHALYHQGLPLEHWGTPMCRPVSLGVNESQSRMWENLVGRSLSFWKYFYPQLVTRFPAMADVTVGAFHRHINEVKPSLIRVDADEVTYNIHILLRFELEVMLASGELEVEDLPEAWNMKIHKFLGLDPPDYSSGLLQDVHWSSGSVGYFPTYTLGNLYAAQLFAQAKKEIGDVDALMERGEFGPLLEWLRKNIHSQGSRYKPRLLVKTVTGEDLNPDYLIEYLREKYLALYDL